MFFSKNNTSPKHSRQKLCVFSSPINERKIRLPQVSFCLRQSVLPGDLWLLFKKNQMTTGDGWSPWLKSGTQIHQLPQIQGVEGYFTASAYFSSTNPCEKLRLAVPHPDLLLMQYHVEQNHKGLGFAIHWFKIICIQILALTVASCVILGEFLNLSKVWFHHWESGGDNNISNGAAEVVEWGNTKHLALPVS